MAITIIATPGATNANSYCTEAEAETYFESQLYKSVWTAATDERKRMALVSATKLLDIHMDWNGSKADEEQSLDWPRYSAYDKNGYAIDSDEIPQILKEAQSELAKYLLEEDRTAESDSKGIKRMKADVLEMEFNLYDRAQVLPDAVWQMLMPLGTRMSGSGMAKIRRV